LNSVGGPENHKRLYDHGTTTLSLWEIDVGAMRKKWEGLVHSSYLNVKILIFTTHILDSTDLNLNKKLGKKQSGILNTYDLPDHQFQGFLRCFGS